VSPAGFDLSLFEAERAARGLGLGQVANWRERTESTNDDAATAAKNGALHGALFGAETQTRGRGRRGSEWVSTPGAGLWFSLLLRPAFGAERAPGLALCAGLAVRAAVAARVSEPVRVKWPNDVLAGARKLAGILVESQLSGSRIASVVVGIGINVAQTAFEGAITDTATSLTLLSATDTSRERLLADVLAQFEAQLAQLSERGMPALAEALAPHDALLGRRLKIDALEGHGAGIDGSGRLRLRLVDGRVELCASGHVQLLDDAAVSA
jgi:BirA family transcriptional regulator, biotin operon repressor / biotin---[acetyl-CoA-carboxylase] ligase